MKKNKVIFCAVILSTLFTSCATMFGVKKTISIVDAPSNVQIKNVATGEIIPITTELVASVGGVSSTGTSFDGGQRFGPAIRVKIKKGLAFEISVKDTTKTVEIGKKDKIGFLIAEGIPTLGTFALVDIITGANKHPNPNFIDVKSLLANKPQRDKFEIWKYIWDNWGVRQKTKSYRQQKVWQ